MARPQKLTVDYFPHFVQHGKTLFVLENSFGNDGYAFWFKLLELLGSTEGHCYDCNNPASWRFLLAKTRVDDAAARAILDTLADLDAIDKELWAGGLVWVQKFVDNIADAYKRRKVSVPQKPSLCRQKPNGGGVNAGINPQIKLNKTILHDNPPLPPLVGNGKNGRAAGQDPGGSVEADEVTATPGEQRARTPFKSHFQEQRFDQFWSEYPKKRAKGQAEKTWLKINPDEQLFEAIMNGLRRAKTSGEWKKDDGQFVPHPATWLNGKRWEDDYREVITGGRGHRPPGPVSTDFSDWER